MTMFSKVTNLIIKKIIVTATDYSYIYFVIELCNTITRNLLFRNSDSTYIQMWSMG